MIPAIQKKPSIIALRYSFADLIPPGHPDHRLNPSTFRLAHSLDAVTWTVVPNSVVDPVNRSVSTIDIVGGYYTIVFPE